MCLYQSETKCEVKKPMLPLDTLSYNKWMLSIMSETEWNWNNGINHVKCLFFILFKLVMIGGDHVSSNHCELMNCSSGTFRNTFVPTRDLVTALTSQWWIYSKHCSTKSSLMGHVKLNETWLLLSLLIIPSVAVPQHMICYGCYCLTWDVGGVLV